MEFIAEAAAFTTAKSLTGSASRRKISRYEMSQSRSWAQLVLIGTCCTLPAAWDMRPVSVMPLQQQSMAQADVGVGRKH
jgi:hypothetical protein